MTTNQIIKCVTRARKEKNKLTISIYKASDTVRRQEDKVPVRKNRQDASSFVLAQAHWRLFGVNRSSIVPMPVDRKGELNFGA